ncbi:MAG: lipoate--protein ligase [Muribaculum sp.]|nr:lipoate--protein ligase [Muribaculum sp.]
MQILKSSTKKEITLVLLPPDTPLKPLPFYLTMEEWLAKKAPEGEYFFMWQVEPTVIFGRNQQIEKEVNLAYCESHGIHFYRRKSGGGCVFADMDNIMFSYITPSVEVQTTFHEYTERVARMLRSLGLNAEATGRNDVTIDSRKVSGNAFYHIPGRSIVHGTMLFSTDMHHMLNAITPSRSKLESKKVKSVASHITTISEHLRDLTIDEFKRKAAAYMADREWMLTPEDVAEIEEMSRPYYTHRWIYGHSPKGEKKDVRSFTRRIENVGELAIAVSLNDHGLIDDINLKGDFFLTGDLDDAILDHLKGLHPDEVDRVLGSLNLSNTIPGLNTSDFSLIISDALQVGK